MDADHADAHLARVAAAIAEPARARILCCLMDGHARTSTELAVVADVNPSTASVHLARLKTQQLVHVLAQGKYRYYQLAGCDVGVALEALLVVAGVPRPGFAPRTPSRLRHARTCYDHMAGAVAVGVHDHLTAHGWLVAVTPGDTAYDLTSQGVEVLERLGLDVQAMRKLRRRFAYACLDWSERRPHIAGQVGAALCQACLDRDRVRRVVGSRALTISPGGRLALDQAFGPRLFG